MKKLTLQFDYYTELSLIRELVRNKRYKIIKDTVKLLPKKERTLKNAQKIEQFILKTTNIFTEQGLCNSILNKIDKLELNIKEDINKR